MKILENAPKWVIYAIYGMFLITMLNTCNRCSDGKQIKKLTTEVETLKVEVESYKNGLDSTRMVTIEDVNKAYEIQGLKISKRILYDNNYIIRTSKRPDDRMNEYDQMIEKLSEK